MVQAPSSGKGVHSLLAGSGAKSDSTSSLVTPSGVAGFHRGALSLSPITARTPSTTSGRRITWQAMRYSIRMLSAKQIGRATCRERVCQIVSISVVDVSLKKKNRHKETQNANEK